MKRLFLIMGFICASKTILFAQDALRWNGYFQPDHRLNVNNGDWLWNENRLSLGLEKKFEEKAKFTADIWIRNMGFQNERELIKIPEIREAKIEIYDFLIQKLDLSIGRQRIKWGTADKINPTDNLNPYDLEDIWDFGRHKSSDAIMLRYYPADDAKIEAVYMPLFSQSQLPIGVYSSLLMPEFVFPDSMAIVQKPGYPSLPLPPKTSIVVDTLALLYQNPLMNLENQSSFAFKAAKQLFGIDFSLSYSYGYDGLPIASEANVEIDSLNLLQNKTYVHVNTQLIYPRFHRFGFDFTGNFKGIGVWGEACLFKPDKTYALSTRLPDVNEVLDFDAGIVQPQIPDSIIFDKNKPWLKFVLGMDYTFSNGIYSNVQYVHGFINERGKDDLNDYYILRLEKKMFNDKLKLAPLSGGFMVSDYSDIENQYALFWLPELSYFPNDNTELIVGFKYIDGKGKAAFSKLKEYDEVYLRLKYSF
ncbi:MAG: hypothetical protein ACUVQP_05290 [Bacteroidales bacterium]